MKNALPRILSLVMVFMFSGCFETPQVTIEGYAKINNNTEHRYKAVVEVDDQASIEAYKWEIVAGEGEYRLLNANSSEVTFSAVDGGNYTLKVMVTVNGKKSMAELTIIVVETQVINGYTLPPEPDPEINNATLLGIDSNTNGVRDDVERWIYMTYDKPIEQAVFMQSAKAYQKVIVDPSKAKENMHIIHDAVDCISYYKRWADNFGEELQIDRYRDIEKEISSIQFNTAERHIAYEKYNHNLSGGIYTSAKPEEKKSKCDFNATELLQGK